MLHIDLAALCNTHSASDQRLYDKTSEVEARRGNGNGIIDSVPEFRAVSDSLNDAELERVLTLVDFANKPVKPQPTTTRTLKEQFAAALKYAEAEELLDGAEARAFALDQLLKAGRFPVGNRSLVEQATLARSVAYDSDSADMSDGEAEAFAKKFVQRRGRFPEGISYAQQWKQAIDAAYSSDGFDMSRDEAGLWAREAMMAWGDQLPTDMPFDEQFKTLWKVGYDSSYLDMQNRETRDFVTEQLKGAQRTPNMSRGAFLEKAYELAYSSSYFDMQEPEARAWAKDMADALGLVGRW